MGVGRRGRHAGVDRRPCEWTVSIEIDHGRACPLDCTNEPARVHHPARVEGRLDPLGEGPVGPGLAPDAEPVLPVGRAAREDQVAAVAGRPRRGGGRPRRRALRGRARPAAWPRTIPLPACAWTAQRPGSSSPTNAATDDGRRLATTLTGPELGGLELGQGRPERRGVGPLADDDVGPAQLVVEPVDLPGDRRGVVLEADGQRPSRRPAGRAARRPAGPPAGSGARARPAGSPRC